MGALQRPGVFKPPKKAVKLSLSTKAVAATPIEKARPTLDKKGPILANGPGGRFTLTWWKCYLDSQLRILSLFLHEGFPVWHKRRQVYHERHLHSWYYLGQHFELCLNKKGIANLQSIIMIKADGYLVSTHTHVNLVATSP